MTLARALVMAMHDGYDPQREEQVGPHTGDFTKMETFEEFLAGVEGQVDFLVETYVTTYCENFERHLRRGDPHAGRTFLTRDCVRNHEAFAWGGARYNWHYVNTLGTTTLIDGVAAVKHCVYDENVLGREELVEALLNDFEGRESLRSHLGDAPKFGNDIGWVDRLGSRLIERAWSGLQSHTGPLGGPFLPSSIPWGLYVFKGKQVAATPDGRRAGKPLNASVGAFHGRDTRGPTALIRSVTRLPLYRALGSPVMNIRVQRHILEDSPGRKKFAAIIRGYMELGGMQIQISVLDAEELRAAQKEPESYRDLMVRIGGYSEYFTALDESFQNTIIARTEHH
jgi:formate C-acetyltransferase